MKIRKDYIILLFYFLFILCTKVFAQKIEYAGRNQPVLCINAQDISRYDIIDSSYVNIYYKFYFKLSESEDTLHHSDRMELMIGKKYMKYYSLSMQELDELCDEMYRKTGWRGKMGVQYNSLVSIMGQGKTLYESIINGGNVHTWKKKDFESFIEYYKLIDIEIIYKLEDSKYGLSPKQIFFSILFYENKTEGEIEGIMGISSSAFRATKTRVKAKITDNSLINLLHF